MPAGSARRYPDGCSSNPVIMRNVFLPIDSDRSPDALLEVAVAVAQALEGRLAIICPAAGEATTTRPDRPKPALAADNRQLLDRARVRWRLIDAAEPVETALHLAERDDGVVVIATHAADRTRHGERHAGQALVDHGAAVFAVPDGAELALRGEVLLLWDGSASSLHALGAALPLLRVAAHVTVLEIDDGSLGRPAVDAAAQLTARGVKAKVRRERAFGEKAGFVILDQIAILKPAYVVMGGFGHARWIEKAMGGVTHRLLADCPVPIFLKH
jgi:nucleotide-binding universal stress UspA family protein